MEGVLASYDIRPENRAGLFSKEKIKEKENISKRKRKQVTRGNRKQVIRRINTRTVYIAPKSTMFLRHIRPWHPHRVLHSGLID